MRSGQGLGDENTNLQLLLMLPMTPRRKER